MQLLLPSSCECVKIAKLNLIANSISEPNLCNFLASASSVTTHLVYLVWKIWNKLLRSNRSQVNVKVRPIWLTIEWIFDDAKKVVQVVDKRRGVGVCKEWGEKFIINFFVIIKTFRLFSWCSTKDFLEEIDQKFIT